MSSRISIAGTALVTGGTSGIGLAFARELARRGLDIVLVARGREALERVAGQLPTHVEVLQADLSTQEGVQAVEKRLEADENPVTVFVNNAGSGLYHSLASADTQPLADGIALMATVPVRLGGVAAAAMQGRGRESFIINTASVSALAPLGLYSGIKALVRTWSMALSVELTGTCVHAVALMPGWVRTQFHARQGVKRSNIPDFMWLSPERVARECLRDAEVGKAISIPSKRYKILAFVASHAPAWLLMAAAKKINAGRTSITGSDRAVGREPKGLGD